MTGNSIKRKLTKVIMFTSTIVLLLTCLCFIIIETFTSRRSLVENIDTLAKIVAANSTAAVAFDNKLDANETLASLKTREDVLSAAIFTREGKLFAKYPSDVAIDAKDMPQYGTHDFEGGTLNFYEPIVQADTRLGTLYIKSDLSRVYARFIVYAEIVVFVLACSILFAYVLSSNLQQRILQPILELAKSAKRVSEQNDYTVRAQKYSNDELGQLTDTFNQMLHQIQKMNVELEQRVKDRTKELENSNKELSRSNSELEQFAYVSSHDLQEPLRMVAGFTSLLADEYKGKLTPEADQYINLIIDGSKRMHALVNDLLEYSRVGRSAVNFDDVDFNKVINTALQNLSVSIAEAKAHVTFDFLPKIIAEPFQMTQLFQNLIGNALKFHSDQSTRIHIGAKEESDHWTFSVKDNGIGIKPEYAERIFLIFQRLHDRKQYPGTGIGLAICKKIVEQHKGKIWVESTLGQGSNFIFTISKELPRRKAAVM
jgi:signal transduction histidine kinase